MRTLSEIRGEDALDVIADIMDPAVEIFSDPKVEEQYRNGRRIDVAKVIVKKHKKAVLKILAIIDGENPKTYAPSLVEIPMKLVALLNDPALAQFFPSQGQNTEETSSGSAMGNIEAIEQE